MSAIRASTPQLIYVLIGSHASGKGTISQLLEAEGYAHISTRDIARDEVQSGNSLVPSYREGVLNHRLVPPEIIQNLVEQRLRKAIEGQKGIILEGYPKSVSQCEFLERFISEQGVETRTIYLFVDVLPENAIDRTVFRQVCDRCKQIFNSKFSPIEDRTEGAVRRAQEFKKKMQPVLDYYAKQGRLHMLDGNATPQACKENFSRFHQLQITKLKSANEGWVAWLLRCVRECFCKVEVEKCEHDLDSANQKVGTNPLHAQKQRAANGAQAPRVRGATTRRIEKLGELAQERAHQLKIAVARAVASEGLVKKLQKEKTELVGQLRLEKASHEKIQSGSSREVGALRAEKGALATRVSLLGGELTTVRYNAGQEQEKLRALLDQASKDNASLQARVGSQAEAVRGAEERTRKVEAESTGLCAKIAQNERDLEQLRLRETELSEKLVQLAAENAQLIEKLSAQASASGVEIERLRKLQRDAKEDLRVIKKKIRFRRSREKALRVEKIELEMRALELEKALHEAQDENESLAEELGKLKKVEGMRDNVFRSLNA